MKRRNLLLAAAAVASPAVLAQSYPARPVKLVVPFPAGGATDILARALSQRLGEKIGQAVLVDNRPGAGGTIGADAASKAPADG
ncbi:MAG: tripartite tricarboxylate transporter substrate-binding protein, partial [Polaromonas sp.]